MKTLSENTKWLTIVILFLLICSCEMYNSNFPISDSSNSTINENWLGKWVGLDATEFQFYPQFEINLQAFNDEEYIASFTLYKNTGKDIRSVDLYKVFNTKFSSGEYLILFFKFRGKCWRSMSCGL